MGMNIAKIAGLAGLILIGAGSVQAEDAAKKEDWHNATLWAGQWWQYQVKTADLGLRAKTYLEQNGARKGK